MLQQKLCCRRNSSSGSGKNQLYTDGYTIQPPINWREKSAENCFERRNYQHLFKNLSSFFTHTQKNHQKVVTWNYCSSIFASFLSFVNHLVSDYSVDQRSKCEYLPSKSELPLCKFNSFCCYAFKTAPSATQRNGSPCYFKFLFLSEVF